ncbi:MAG: serine protease [Patescibacteria group bacterium]|nr:serine protease [Patescibacteria group bacterium]MBU2509091.1 serine protease [Patescibacteria group bacterium]
MHSYIRNTSFVIRNSHKFIPLLILAGILSSSIVTAADIPFTTRQAVVMVHCGNRQGSGVVINSEKGYVLTNAHIVMDVETLIPANYCEVGFITDLTYQPRVYYEADWIKYVFDQNNNRDFAILEIGDRLQQRELEEFPYLKTDEFSEVGDLLSIIAYPSIANGKQTITSGEITGLEQGMVKTDAKISSGASGGAGVDTDNNLTGMATRILYREISPGIEEVVDYELVDIRAILNWLDTFGENTHDQYFTHADYDRYHGPASLFTPGNLECTMLAKSALSDTVYCLRANGTRSVFPNSATYFTWFSDFSGVVTLPNEQLAGYRLSTNVTMKPGTMIKIQTDPKVYIVSDVSGTIRWINNEEQVIELYGQGWAGFVKDVPDTFFINYKRGVPVE